MNRQQNSYLSTEPSLKISRSKFSLPPFDHKCTFDNGELVPIYSDEIYPGDTVVLDMSAVVRMTTPVKPIMDSLFLDVFFFFVPNRLVWTHWREFMGENRSTKWESSVTYQVPHVKAPKGFDPTRIDPGRTILPGSGIWFKSYLKDVTDPYLSSERAELCSRGVLGYTTAGSDVASGVIICPSNHTFDPTTYDYYLIFCGWDVGSLADHFEMPIGTYCEVNALYFRAYGLIWNEFFRSEPYMDPVNVNFNSDVDINGKARGDIYGVNPILDIVKGARPLRVSRFHDYFSSVLPEPTLGDPVRIPFDGMAPIDNDINPSANHFRPKFYDSSGSALSGGFDLGGVSNGLLRNVDSNWLSGAQVTTMSLSADIQSVAGTIQSLRDAFQVTRYLERSARSGTRYTEIIQVQFGVRNPDYRVQRPEYLGGFRRPLNITQVLQTSSTDSTTPQGNTAAYSLTGLKESVFTYSATEHGIIIGLACTRTSRSYNQGLERKFSRRRKLDYYFPVFAHKSEDPVLNRELFNWYLDLSTVNGSAYTYPEEVFGYQEPYGDLRYHQSHVCGDFRPNAPEPLDFWHFSDYYEDDVYASMDWMLEGPENVDRTLAVTSGVSRQFLADFGFKVDMVRPMPMYGIPGLADHF